jgi:DNA-binding NarL/FixJ family response regulator
MYEVSSIRVVVAEAEELTREALALELGSIEGIEIVDWVDSVPALYRSVAEHAPELVILGVQSLEGDALQAFASIRKQWPLVNVLVFDAQFRVAHMSPGFSQQERLDLSAWVVATQLVPKVTSLFKTMAIR